MPPPTGTTPPMPELFSAPWTDAVCAALNDSEAYRSAGAGWDGAIALVAEPGGPLADARMVWLDLAHGACRGALAGADAETAEAPFTIAAPYPVWADVLAGRQDPILGLMLGKLRLTGSMATVAAHAAAAKALVAVAASVESTPPAA